MDGRPTVGKADHTFGKVCMTVVSAAARSCLMELQRLLCFIFRTENRALFGVLFPPQSVVPKGDCHGPRDMAPSLL